jgi:hypothetical protein
MRTLKIAKESQEKEIHEILKVVSRCDKTVETR